jgi:SAM-dependent methyltransferase
MEHQPDASRLLDIGAGLGSVVMAARERGLEAQGVEVNPHAVEWAVRNHGVHLRGQPFQAGLFPDRFDIVTCNHVLEHLEAPRLLIADAITSLMPGGLLFLSVPFLPEPRSEALRYVVEPDSPGSPFFDNDVHITHFTRQGLLAMAQSLGLGHSERVDGGRSGYVLRLGV